jgi:hypothetical protein
VRVRISKLVNGCIEVARAIEKELEASGDGVALDSSAGEKQSSIPEAVANHGSSTTSTVLEAREPYQHQTMATATPSQLVEAVTIYR